MGLTQPHLQPEHPRARHRDAGHGPGHGSRRRAVAGGRRAESVRERRRRSDRLEHEPVARRVLSVHAVAERRAHDQYGFLGDRSRQSPSQPHALQSVLPREARFLLDGRRSVRVRPHQRQWLQRRQRGDVAAEPRERAAVLLAPHRLERCGNARRHRLWRQVERARRAMELGLARDQPGRVRDRRRTGLRRSAGLVRRARLGECSRGIERRHRHDRRQSAGEHRQ